MFHYPWGEGLTKTLTVCEFFFFCIFWIFDFHKMYLYPCRQADGSWVCRVCGKTIVGRQARGNMKQHVETHIEGIQHTCTTCGKTYKNRNSLHTHISMKHRYSIFAKYTKLSVFQNNLLKEETS